MKKLIIILMFLPFVAKAQDYNTSFGVRAGSPAGFTLKHFISEKAAIEGIAGIGGYGISLTALYEIHVPALDVSGLNWFYGLGVHGGIYNRGWGFGGRIIDGPATPGGGFDGIFGLEYQIGEIPFTVGIDYKPGINVYPLRLLWFDGGVSFRYVF